MSSESAPTESAAVTEPSDSESGENDAVEGPKDTDQPNADATDSLTTSNTDEVTQTYTARFGGFVLLFGVLIAVGVGTFHPAAIGAAGLLLVFLVVGVLQTPTAPSPHLTVTYNVEPEHPRPADTVTITTTIENTGDATFTDLRVIDAVPNELQVTGGSPRGAGPLRPGDALTAEYTVTARRGSYTFGSLTARTRTLIGSMWTQEILTPAEPGRFRCAVKPDDIPIEDETEHLIGGLLSDDGGEGVEFYSTREYHRGDSPSQINWRELAKRGELNTITYREHQSAEITVIMDVRAQTRVSAGAGSPAGAELVAYAAYQLTNALTDAGHYVGVTAPGLEPRESKRGDTAFPYRRLEPRGSKDQQHLVFDLLDDIDAALEDTTVEPDEVFVRPGMYKEPDSEEYQLDVRDPGTGSFTGVDPAATVFDTETANLTVGDFTQDLAVWTKSTAQFVFVTPLLDSGSLGLCVQLQKLGVPITVISPDVTTATVTESETDRDSQSVPARTLRLQRATRIESLRRRGITVIDWDPTVPMSVACERQLPKGALS